MSHSLPNTIMCIAISDQLLLVLANTIASCRHVSVNLINLKPGVPKSPGAAEVRYVIYVLDSSM
jgi:hypothetical protein